MTENQTQFASGSLIYEPMVDAKERQTKRRQMIKKYKPVIIGLSLILVILLGVAVWARFRAKPTVSPEQKEVITPAEIKKLTDPFTKRLTELQQELEKADPSQEDLPFPPVDLKLELEN